MIEIEKYIKDLKICKFPKSINEFSDPIDFFREKSEFYFTTDILLKNVLNICLLNKDYQIVISDADTSDEGISHIIVNSNRIHRLGQSIVEFNISELKNIIAVYTNRTDSFLEFDDENFQSYLYLLRFNGYSSGIVYSSQGFDAKLLNFSKKCYPYALQLIKHDDLERISDVLDIKQDNIKMTFLIREMCTALIKYIAEKGVSFLNNIEWRDLERVLAELFWVNGFKVELTSSSKDGGKDIIIYSRDNKSKEKYYIEIKHWRSGVKVTEKTIKSFIEIIIKDDIKKGIIFSTSGYNSNVMCANICIHNVDLKLWGKNEIYSMAKAYLKNRFGLFEENTDLFKEF